MPVTLLPASAAAFAPRASPNVVLNAKAEPWLTATLKRVNRVKRPLNSGPQHQRCLTDILSGSNAFWTLCSLMLPKAPEAKLRRDDNPLVEALSNYQLLHIQAYVVHVDLVSQNEVAFKLTKATIDALISYHKDIFSVDTSNNTWNWSEKETQLKKLHADFVQAANRFVFRTDAHALEGLEEDGAGELLAGGAEKAKLQIMGLFLPLMPPPPPRVPDVVRMAPVLPSSTGSEAAFWPSALASQQQQQQAAAAAAAASASMSMAPSAPAALPSHLDGWKILPSSPHASSAPTSMPVPAPTSVPAESTPDAAWNPALNLESFETPSPVPSFCQPYSSSAIASLASSASSVSSVSSASPWSSPADAFAQISYHGPAVTSDPMQGCAVTSVPYAGSPVISDPFSGAALSGDPLTGAGLDAEPLFSCDMQDQSMPCGSMDFATITSAPLMPSLSMIGAVPQTCATTAGLGSFSGGFGWDNYSGYATSYAT